MECAYQIKNLIMTDLIMTDLKNLKIGDKVIDEFYNEWGIGTCIDKTENLWYIDFENNPPNNPLCYDRLHSSFLKPYKEYEDEKA